MTVQEWLGTENQLGQDIWERKYRYENETFDEWINRVSGGNSEIANLIKEKKFLFGGRILANRGLENKGRKISLSNCYVIEPPEDNIESIFDCAKNLLVHIAMVVDVELILVNYLQEVQRSIMPLKKQLVLYHLWTYILWLLD